MCSIPLTPKVDVYSYGIVLWEMLSRDSYFHDILWAGEIADQVTSGNRPAIPSCSPPSYSKLIEMCWVRFNSSFCIFIVHSKIERVKGQNGNL